MYETFFGLAERPFELTPNPRYLCLTEQHREALSTLKYGIGTARGITLLVGEAGTGKTTLIQSALAALARNEETLCVSLANPTLSRAEFVHFLAHEFDLSQEAATSKFVMLKELLELLCTRRRRGALTMLVIDEAQSLPYELLEEVRLLANLETAEEKLLPVILAGQPELAERLEEPSLRQLKQRVSLRCTVAPLDFQDTAAYMSARIRTAGGSGAQVFTRESVEQIYAHSRGIPRTVNVISDNVMLAGFARGERPVTSRLVAEVCGHLALRRAPGNGIGHSPTTVPPYSRLLDDQAEEVSSATGANGGGLFQMLRRDKRR
jgi:type II secretory pathway predicted ATPase ExeA